MIQGVHLENISSEIQSNMKEKLTNYFAMERIGSSGDKRKCSVLVSGGRERDHGLLLAKLLQLFRKNVKRSIESQEYAFIKYMEVICVIEMVKETLRFICLSCNTDDEMNHSLTRGAGIWGRGGLTIGEQSTIKRLEAVQYCVYVSRANSAIARLS